MSVCTVLRQDLKARLGGQHAVAASGAAIDAAAAAGAIGATAAGGAIDAAATANATGATAAGGADAGSWYRQHQLNLANQAAEMVHYAAAHDGDDSTDDDNDDASNAGDAVDAVDDAGEDDVGSTLCQSKTAKRHRRRRRNWNASVAAGTEQGLSESQRRRQRKRKRDQATASSSSTLPAGQPAMSPEMRAHLDHALSIAPWRTPPQSAPEHDHDSRVP